MFHVPNKSHDLQYYYCMIIWIIKTSNVYHFMNKEFLKMKNKTYYLGKMTYHKRNKDFELPYVLEKDINNFSFLTKYKGYVGKIPHLSVFDAYLIRQDELNTGRFNIMFKSISSDEMYFIDTTQDFCDCVEQSRILSNFIGNHSKFMFEFNNVNSFKEITN